MEAAARAALILILVALFVNFAQGGQSRVKRWAVRTLTGKDLVGPPVQGPPAPAALTSTPATPTHYVMKV